MSWWLSLTCLLTNDAIGRMSCPNNVTRSVSPTINLTHAINVSKVCFDNNGAYDLKWNYQDCPANVQSPWSPAFP